MNYYWEIFGYVCIFFYIATIFFAKIKNQQISKWIIRSLQVTPIIAFFQLLFFTRNMEYRKIDLKNRFIEFFTFLKNKKIYIFSILILIIVCVYFLFFYFQKTLVTNDDMLPTLKKNDYVIIDFDDVSPCRGCIISHTGIEETSTPWYVHRIVGLPGDKIKFSFKTKSIVINNTSVSKIHIENYLNSNHIFNDRYKERLGEFEYDVIYNEPFEFHHYEEGEYLIHFPKNNCLIDDDGFYCSIPNDSIFVAGDNRTLNSFGIIKITDIWGKIRLSIF